MTAIDEPYYPGEDFDFWHDEREERRTATALAPHTPKPGSLADAIERGYSERDEYED